jgi:SAM-dependent methyltransferase
VADRDADYLLGNAIDGAQRRLAALADLFDRWTFDHFDQLGLGDGWRCWEVGAGGPSVVQGLAQRVGPSGRVLATDIDVAWAEETSAPNVEVRVHDVAADGVPDESFDLVHARLVLVHVGARDVGLANMVAALRPGGWLVVEDADPALQPLSCLDPTTEEEALANRIRSGFRSLMVDRGVDLAYGRKLPRLLRGAGLVQVKADAYFPVSQPECATVELATISMIRDQLVDNGIASVQEIERHEQAVAAGIVDIVQPPLVTAWGKRT